MVYIYTDVHAHFPDSGNCIRLLFMEHKDCACTEKCSWTSRTLIKFPLRVFDWIGTEIDMSYSYSQWILNISTVYGK